MSKIPLDNEIEKRGLTIKLVAKKLGIHSFMLYLRIWGVVEFTLEEIREIIKILGLTEPETAQIFFNKMFPKGNK